MTLEPFTITAKPGQWRYISAYEPWSIVREYAAKYSVALADTNLLPEEIANEVHVTKKGYVYAKTDVPPQIQHFEGWEKLESELRRMRASNLKPDDLFDGAILEITIQPYIMPARPDRGFHEQALLLAPLLIKIVGYEDASEAASGDDKGP